VGTARRDGLVAAGALALGALIGAALSLGFGRGPVGDELLSLLGTQGRWLAGAWVLAALARGRWTAPLVGGLFVAGLTVARELVPLEGIEAAARGAGLAPERAASVAAGFDQNDGGVDAVVIAAGVVMGAGAALWRHAAGWPRALGAALLAGALLRDTAAGHFGLEPTLPGALDPPSLAGIALAAQLALALLLLVRLVAPGRRIATLGAAAAIAGALIALPEAALIPHPEIQVIE